MDKKCRTLLALSIMKIPIWSLGVGALLIILGLIYNFEPTGSAYLFPFVVFPLHDSAGIPSRDVTESCIDV